MRLSDQRLSYLSETEETAERSLIRLMELLKADLAGLSPLRRRAA